MEKLPFILAIIGHVLCGVTDCLIGFSPKGRLDMKSVKDPDKMSQTFRDMPGSFPMLSMLLGTLAITMFSFGYFELCNWMREFSGTASVIMYISTIIYLVPIVTHHVFCGAAEWIYIRFGRTNEARDAVFEFLKKTSPTMILGYAGILTFVVTLFVMIVSGNTSLPMWACDTWRDFRTVRSGTLSGLRHNSRGRRQRAFRHRPLRKCRRRCGGSRGQGIQADEKGILH